VTHRSRPFPVVIAAPSGAGKTSLAQKLVERNDDIVFSVSATTRPQRAYERDGEHYYFVNDAAFDAMAAAGELLEWASVHDRRYGTPRMGVEDAIARGRYVVLDIDFQGARQVRRSFPDAVLIFVLPPSGEELRRRLSGRASEDRAQQLRRVHTARQELAAVNEFEYVVVNDDFAEALATIEAIVVAERHRVTRMLDLHARLEDLGHSLDQWIERESVG
jgi:guanylate kinase